MIINSIKQSATILSKIPKHFDQIIESVGDSQVVLIGEASHGTHEFYKWRAEITKRLIIEKGFTIIGCEADWPDMYKVNQYVKNVRGSPERPDEALDLFQRFPRWMWRNADVLDFVTWLRLHNETEKKETAVGMYGLDLYSLRSSMEAVIEYLEKVDPDLAQKAKDNYACFGNYDSKTYGKLASMNMTKSCEREVLNVVQEILSHQSKLIEQNPEESEDSFFFAKQNAKVVQDAENYYRNIFSGRVNTWNIRDTHMLDTLVALLEHYSQSMGQQKKAVIWAHNSHIGDASQTENRRRKKVNIGQLAREHFGIANTFNIGFTTYTGSVTAANNWGEDPQFKLVNEGMEGSYEKLFHEVVAKMEGVNFGDAAFSLIFRSNYSQTSKYVATKECIKYLMNSKLERAIGVVYRPQTERQSHYFQCCLPKQFDVIIHIDTTQAIHPLEHHPQWVQGRLDNIPAAYPGISLPKQTEDDYDAARDFSPKDVTLTSQEPPGTSHSRLFDRFPTLSHHRSGRKR